MDLLNFDSELLRRYERRKDLDSGGWGSVAHYHLDNNSQEESENGKALPEDIVLRRIKLTLTKDQRSQLKRDLTALKTVLEPTAKTAKVHDLCKNSHFILTGRPMPEEADEVDEELLDGDESQAEEVDDEEYASDFEEAVRDFPADSPAKIDPDQESLRSSKSSEVKSRRISRQQSVAAAQKQVSPDLEVVEKVFEETIAFAVCTASGRFNFLQGDEVETKRGEMRSWLKNAIEEKYFVELIGTNVKLDELDEEGDVEREYVFVYEAMEGNLEKYIWDNWLDLGAKNVLNYCFLELAKGLDILHTMGQFHGALNPWNIFSKPCAFDPSIHRFLLGDLGITLHSENRKELRAQTDGPHSRYLAPEVKNGQEYSLTSDIFSLGMIFNEVMKHIKKESDPNDKLGVPLGELIKSMTGEVPEERPVLEQVIRTLESLI